MPPPPHNPLVTLRSVLVFLLAICLSTLSSCSSTSSSSGTPPEKSSYWRYDDSPGANTDGLAPRADDEKRLVVIGRFSDVSRSRLSRYYEIGEGMTDALARALINHSAFDVWVYPELVQQVEQYIVSPREEQVHGLALVHEKYPTISYVITGKVTDFYHTDELAPEARRSGFFGGRCEAIVAIQLTIVDVPANRVVVSDHVYGTSSTGKKASMDLYEGIAFGSVLFWNTPLGKASQEAIGNAMTRLNQIVPTLDLQSPDVPGPYRIVDVLSPQMVRISAGANTTLREAEEFFLFPFDKTSSTHLEDPLRDPDTGLPLRVYLLDSHRISSTARLVGRVPPHIDLMSVDLRPIPPMDRDLPITSQTGQRELVIDGWFTEPPEDEIDYYVCLPDLETPFGRMRVLHDPDTKLPLRARLLRSHRSGIVAGLLGRKPHGVDLTAGVLRPPHIVDNAYQPIVRGTQPEPASE